MHLYYAQLDQTFKHGIGIGALGLQKLSLIAKLGVRFVQSG